MTEEQIGRLRQAFVEGEPAGGCPSADELWQAAQGRASPSATAAVVDHVATCGTCAAGWRVANELAGPTTTAAAPARPLHRRRPLVVGASLAAAFAVAAGMLLWPRRIEPPVWRAPDDQAIRLLVTEGAELERLRFVLRWESAGEGARYTVTVAHPDLSIVTTAVGLSATELQVAAADLAAIPAGATLVWHVEATLAGGARRRSMTAEVHVR